MNQTDNTHNHQPPRKKAWQAPALRILGDLRVLTETGSGRRNESAMGGNCGMAHAINPSPNNMC